MTPAQQIALWADKLRDVSATGGMFAENHYDEANYRVIQDVAMSLLAMATGDDLEQIEPLRAPVFARPTPISVGDAAVIDDKGRILLIRRADNGLWAMPGGALEVGETPAAGVVREAWEETAIRCEATHLVGVHDSRLCGSQSRHHLYHFLFLCRPLNSTPEGAPSHGDEVLEAGWFAEYGLPDELVPCHARRIPEAYRIWRGDDRAYFDS